MLDRMLDTLAGAVLPKRRASACYRNPHDWYQCISGTWFHCYVFCSGAQTCYNLGTC